MNKYTKFEAEIIYISGVFSVFGKVGTNTYVDCLETEFEEVLVEENKFHTFEPPALTRNLPLQSEESELKSFSVEHSIGENAQSSVDENSVKKFDN